MKKKAAPPEAETTAKFLADKRIALILHEREQALSPVLLAFAMGMYYRGFDDGAASQKVKENDPSSRAGAARETDPQAPTT